MKKVIFSLWFIISVGTLLGLLTYGISTLPGISLSLPLIPLALISIGGAIFLLLLLRRHLEVIARGLYIAFIAFTAGGMVGVFVLEVASLLAVYPLPYLASVIAGLLVIVFMILFLRKRPLAFFVMTLIFTFLALSTVFVMASMEKKIVEETVARWKSRGLPVEAQEVFPKPSTEKACQDFFDRLASIQKNKEWENFYRQVISKMIKKTSEALAQGEDLKSLLESWTPEKNPQWEALKKYNQAILAIFPSCPYIQRFDPQRHTEDPLEVPVQMLFDFIQWAKGMAAEGLMDARDGNFSRARQRALAIHEAAKKLENPGQLLIENLIAISMKKLAYMTIVAIQTLEKKPLPQAFRIQLLTKGKSDPTWAVSFMDAEAYFLQQRYRKATLQAIYRIKSPREPGLRWKPLMRAILLHWAKHDLPKASHLLIWLHTVPDFQRGIYHWHDARKHLRDSPYLSIYMRLLSGITAYYLVDAVDQIMAYFLENQRVPENVEDLPGPLPMDPFTDQPLKYTRLRDRECLVYSLGPDEKPGDPDNLYVYGIMKSKEPRDLGYHLIF